MASSNVLAASQVNSLFLDYLCTFQTDWFSLRVFTFPVERENGFDIDAFTEPKAHALGTEAVETIHCFLEQIYGYALGNDKHPLFLLNGQRYRSAQFMKKSSEGIDYDTVMRHC